VVLLFADCRLDLDARRLFRGAREVHLPPKAFALLTLLVESRPRALSKAELIERVWQGVFVSDVTLAKVVNQIRSGIGDDARGSRIVRTVHGYGYVFAAKAVLEDTPPPVSLPTRGPICWLVSGGREFALPDGEHIVGREPGSAVWLDSPKVSRCHAKILVTGSRVIIEDLGSKNGTIVGKTRIDAPAVLSSGDQVRIGPFTLTVRLSGTGSATESESSTSLEKL
jgi:DNA-binding winged helix-turn-helix (wHTH) protein